MIPEHTKYQIDEYVKHQIPPGSFVMAVLSNDLMEAFMRADDINLHYMRDIVKYVYNDIPSCCWGSPEIVKTFIGLREEKIEREKKDKALKESENANL